MVNDPVVIPALPLAHRSAELHQHFDLCLAVFLADAVVLDFHTPELAVAFPVVVRSTKVAFVVRALSRVELGGDVAASFQILDDFGGASPGVVAPVLRNEEQLWRISTA